jgi:hypothetical protein
MRLVAVDPSVWEKEIDTLVDPMSGVAQKMTEPCWLGPKLSATYRSLATMIHSFMCAMHGEQATT